MTSQYDVRAVSLDLDGCCFPKNKLPEQPDLLAAYLKTQEGLDSVINLGAYLTRQPPLAFAINTGRSWSASYPVVQTMAGDDLIMVVEHGHAIRMPGEDRPRGMDEIDKKYEPQMRALKQIREALQKDPEIAKHEIHKDYFVAVRIPRDVGEDEFCRMIFARLDSTQRALFKDKENGLEALYSHGAIDIRVRGLTKGTGLRRVSEAMNIPLDKWLAIEDTDRDLLVHPYNRHTRKGNVGYAGCPEDASDEVKNVVWEEYMFGRIENGTHNRIRGPTISSQVRRASSRGHIASQENGRGTLEILKHFLGD